MKKIMLMGAVAILIIVFSACSGLPEQYHMDKKYWTVSDYDAALVYIKYVLDDKEGYPRLSDPETAPVFNKLIDKNNFEVIISDETLGLEYRNDVAEKFFNIAKDLVHIYSKTNIQGKFIYPTELVRTKDYFMYLQILYFKYGNDEIIKKSINPKEARIKNLISSNEQTVVNNFHTDLEFLLKEDALSDQAKKEYSEILSDNFGKLMEVYPDANYSQIKTTCTHLNKKLKTPEIKSTLEDLIKKIESLN